MNKFIVITSINSPTEATKKFISFKDWKVIVVGDLKTPHKEYESLDCIYLNPHYQENIYPDLSNLIGWNSIQRRNIGFIEAYKLGADIIATVDDDNIPYDNWGEELLIKKEIECDLWVSERVSYMDPLAPTNNNNLWHRGYPLELVKLKNEITYAGKIKRTPKIQASLWDGDPDIDAFQRLTKEPIVKFNNINPYCFNTISPFNSQNTFISRELIPFYAVLPFVGRMDDIWGGYLLQQLFPDSLIYTKSTVYQNRNKQNLIKNLKDELLGYENNMNFLSNISLIHTYIPEKTREFYKIYRGCFK